MTSQGFPPKKNDPKKKNHRLLVQADGRTDQGGNLGMDEWKGEYLCGDCIYVWEIANRHVDIYTLIYTRQRCFFACFYVYACICHMHMYTHIYIYTLYVHMYIYTYTYAFT